VTESTLVPSGVTLGLGLIGIGRPWPDESRPVPDEKAVDELLTTAVDLGIRFFDTAAAYGLSEERLGRALRGALRRWRNEVIIATKCGEVWANGISRTDHSPDALRRSIDRSIRRLGRIDLLQLHKATSDTLAEEVVLDTLRDIARSHGIASLEVSAKDPETCQLALECGLFTHVQCPFPHADPAMADWIQASLEKITILVNRPLGSGRLLGTSSAAQLYDRITETLTRGIVLTGTTSQRHLAETSSFFRTSRRS
jgi:aryl-alcohol dehydrogenase-like predicted oxidoreductase